MLALLVRFQVAPATVCAVGRSWSDHRRVRARAARRGGDRLAARRVGHQDEPHRQAARLRRRPDHRSRDVTDRRVGGRGPVQRRTGSRSPRRRPAGVARRPGGCGRAPSVAGGARRSRSGAGRRGVRRRSGCRGPPGRRASQRPRPRPPRRGTPWWVIDGRRVGRLSRAHRRALIAGAHAARVSICRAEATMQREVAP